MYALVMAALVFFPWVATAYIAWGSARAHRHGPPQVREESIISELARCPGRDRGNPTPPGTRTA